MNLDALFNNENKMRLAIESTKCLLVHSTNPIKTAIMIIDALKIIEHKYIVLEYLTESMVEKLIIITIEFLDNLGTCILS